MIKKCCVIKAGSAVVTQKNGTLDFNMIADLCHQIANLHKAGWKPILVTSGAVAAGRGFLIRRSQNQDVPGISSRSFAALGQSRLLSFYTDMLESEAVPLHTAQVLLTREAFADRSRYGALRESLVEMVHANILPIINNNDLLHVPALDFADNDQLAGYVAGMLNPEQLILLSNVDGIYTSNPFKDKSAQKIDSLNTSEPWPEIAIDDSNASFGGMTNKLNAVKLMAALGIPCCVVKGREPDVLRRAVIDRDASLGTFLRIKSRPKLDNMKRWLATGASPAGTIIVSNLGTDVLKRRTKRGSLLAAGVEDVIGRFEPDEVVAIRDENFALVGIGIARQGSPELREKIGRSQETVVVHADYFFSSAEGLFASDEKRTVEAAIAALKKHGYRCKLSKRKKYISLIRRVGKDRSEETEVIPRIFGADAVKLLGMATNAAAQFGLSEDDWLIYYFGSLHPLISTAPGASDAKS